MASEEADGKLTNLFTKLQDLIANGQGVSKKAVRVIEDILKLAPNDVDALSAKAVALVKQEKFGDALVFLKAHPTVAADLSFEKAYCLYRLGRFDEALQAVRGAGDSREVAALQLEAQIQYRLGNNEEAIRIYSDLSRTHKLESLELRTNVVAAYVAGGRSSEAGAVMEAMHSSVADSYELAFNRACALMEEGDYPAAEEQLQLALRTGQEDLFEEDIGEQAIEEELAPLTVQLALVQSRLGRHDEALAAYQALEKLDLDAATAAVLLNNAAAEGMAEPSLGAQPKARLKEALRRLDALMEKAAGPSQTVAATLQTRLSSRQQETILCNRALLMVAVNKVEAARVAVASFEQQFPQSPKLRLMRASLLARDNKGSEADTALADAPPDVQPMASLMRVQLALAAGDRASAATRLADLSDSELQHRPAVVATLSALQEQLGDTTAAEATLTSALDWWRGSMTAEPSASSAAQAWILRRLTQLAIAADRVSDATRHFQELMALDPEAPANLEVLAALACAFGRQREQGAEVLEQRLPPTNALPAAEVDALETAVVKGAARRTAKDSSAAPGAAIVGSKREGAPEEAGPKKRRKRKLRLPKNFDPVNPGPPPDPERWLPKWQRSDFKKKKPDRNARSRKDVVKGSQGAGRVDESLDISKQAVSEGPKLPPGRGSRSTAGGGRKKGRR